MTKPDTKTVTRTISIPKTKIVKQPAKKTANQKAIKNTEPRSKVPTRPQKPSPNQPANRQAFENHTVICDFTLSIVLDDSLVDWHSEGGKRYSPLDIAHINSQFEIY